MKKLYIIDASGYLFRSYFAIRNITNARGESTNALFGFIRSVMKLIKDFHPDYIVAVFDGPNNSSAREAIYSDYKAHRSEMPGDLGYQIRWAHQFCELMGIPHLNIADVEADDTMGTVALWGKQHSFTTYLCTSDKDMCQLVDEKTFILNTFKENLVWGVAEVEQNFGVPPKQMVDWLAIVGDSSDNVPGIPGFGPKTATALLQEAGSLDNMLSHPEKIANQKRRDVVLQEKEKVLLSRKLVSLKTDVEIPNDLNFYALKPPKMVDLKDFYASMNFNSLIRELEEAPVAQESKPVLAESTAYHLVDDEQALHKLIQLLSQHKEICFTTEATHTQPLKGELLGLGFSVKEKDAWYVPVEGVLGKQKVLEALKPLFLSHGFYGHNVKYDILVLAKEGIEVKKITFDTTLASYLLNSHSRQHNLEHLTLEYFGKIMTSIESLTGKGKKEISLREVEIAKVVHHCCEMADFSFRLKQVLEQQLQERKLLKLLLELELPLLPVLAKMEKAGIFVDLPYLSHMSKELMREIQHLEQEIYQMAGETFNLNSPKQLSHILFTKMGIHPPKKTATGHSTNADVLESLREEHPLAGKLLDYRVLEKLRSTYVDALPEEVNPKTERIHCNFNQTVTATGRLSCQDPNLQNIPVRSDLGRKIRKAFRPQKEGWSYLAADYSQIELRLLAHLSEDLRLIEAFKNHEDIHTRTAAAILHIPIDQVTKGQRYQAKAVNFGIVYGQQAFGLSQELGIDVKEAGNFINAYFNQFPLIRKFVEECKEKTRQTGRAVTMTGRERLIPEIHSKNHMIRVAAERLAVNTPLQGTAADLIKMAMIQIDRELCKENLRAEMILQIHDELLFEVPNEEIPQLEKLVRNIMQNVFSLKVPLVVDITIGKNWEEC